MRLSKMQRIHLPSFITLICLLAPAPLKADTDCAAAFRWFEGLGFPQIDAESQFVRIYTGAWYQSGKSNPQNTIVHGFLTASDVKTFSAWTFDFAEKEFVRTPPDTPLHQQV